MHRGRDGPEVHTAFLPEAIDYDPLCNSWNRHVGFCRQVTWPEQISRDQHLYELYNEWRIISFFLLHKPCFQIVLDAKTKCLFKIYLHDQLCMTFSPTWDVTSSGFWAKGEISCNPPSYGTRVNQAATFFFLLWLMYRWVMIIVPSVLPAVQTVYLIFEGVTCFTNWHLIRVVAYPKVTQWNILRHYMFLVRLLHHFHCCYIYMCCQQAIQIIPFYLFDSWLCNAGKV